jgi:rhodanese-related sulfurtransferase
MNQAIELIDVTAVEASTMIANDPVLLVDVREIDEYAAKHIKGSLLMPMSVFDPEDFPQLRLPGLKVMMVCGIGKRSLAAAKMLRGAGFDGPLYNLVSGIKGWAEAGLPVVLAPDDYSI